jgi:hypothetical protein
MICSRCLQRSVPSRFIRPFSSTSLLSQTPPSSTSASPRTKGPPTVTSTGAAQPFSTPLSPSPTALGITSHPAKKSATPLPVSSAPEGTVLKGINYIKGHNDPVALKEEEYPEWLWHCLDVSKKTAEEDAAGDEFCKFIYLFPLNSVLLHNASHSIPPHHLPAPPYQALETNHPPPSSQIQESPSKSRKSEAQSRRAGDRFRRHEYSRTQDPDHAADD